MSASDTEHLGNRLARWEKTVGVLTVVAVCSVLTLAAELGLRAAGRRPGFDEISALVAVREGRLDLTVSEPFFTDQEGVFRANPGFDWTTWDERGVSLNEAGFRSRPLVRALSAEPTILFLGDSFTWGNAADPLTESFADQVDRAGYHVYNTGIPGTGPVQYRYLASKYVPSLRPDIVATMFFLGNDLGSETDRMRPGQNLHHITNVGWIHAFDEAGRYLTPRAALDHHFELSYGGSFKNRVKLRLLRSVLGSKFWFLLRNAKHAILGPAPEPSRPAGSSAASALPTIRDHLLEIRRIAEENGSRFVLFIIPVCPAMREVSTTFDYNRRVFDELDPRYPGSPIARHFASNCHFNNDGHDAYTEFILEELAAGPTGNVGE